jgi:predicted RNase H-like HicB family nuclease
MRTFTVVVHEDPEGGFWGEVPALPGCYSQGESIDELRENIREAIAGVLEVLREQGQEPEPSVRIMDVAVSNRSAGPKCAG